MSSENLSWKPSEMNAKLGVLIVLPVVLTFGLIHAVIRAGRYQIGPGAPVEAANGYNKAVRRSDDALRRSGDNDTFAFAVATDMRFFAGTGSYDTSQYFRGAAEAIGALDGSAFIVSPGDVDPPNKVLWTITQTLGMTYTWYPVVGNHELPGWGVEPSYGDNMDWLREYDYGTVGPGPTGCPTTTYSFDFETAHFVMLNEYCDSTGDDVARGNVPDHLYDWLANDLSNTDKAHIFVFGHEPAYPQPDADNGRFRHLGYSLDKYPTNRDRFWHLLEDRGVTAYICGHTHNYSAVEIDDVWQLDAGHARGIGDTGARSTFLIIYVDGGGVTLETYRDDADGGEYALEHRKILVEEPLAGLVATNDGPVALGGVITFTATITSVSNVTYTWAFDDGASGSGNVTTRTYQTLGTHTAVVTATGSLNAITDTTSAIVGYPVYVPSVLGSNPPR